MSFLDKVTKAVGDVVDRGKKEVDQFMRVQKINGEISEIERKIAEFRRQTEQIKVEIGAKVLERLPSGTLVAADFQPKASEIARIDAEIASEQARIAEKRAEIERIKAEDHVPAPPPAAVAPVEPPPAVHEPASALAEPAVTAAPLETEAPAAPGPATQPGPSVCPACGKPIGEDAAFCGECGTKLH